MKNEAKNTDVKNNILETVKTVVIAFAIALAINNFLIANIVVPTSSMESTIMAGSRVVGGRLHYTFGDPKFQDVAVFKYGKFCPNCRNHVEHGLNKCPLCGSKVSGRTIYYIKRIIGCPGDHIEIRQGNEITEGVFEANVYRNGELLNESYINGKMEYSSDMTFDVPEDSYFLMGDNRNASYDCRFWNNHYVSKDRMVAKAFFEYFPKIKTIQ